MNKVEFMTLSKFKQQGFTLLEVLVSLVVLSIGLLGLAALQLQGLKYNHDAYVRTQGTFLAYDLIERMRANSANADNYVGAAPGDACGAAANLATDDRACWHADIAATLPGGTATVTQDAADTTLFTTTISWADRNAAAGVTTTQAWTFVITP